MAWPHAPATEKGLQLRLCRVARGLRCITNEANATEPRRAHRREMCAGAHLRRPARAAATPLHGRVAGADDLGSLRAGPPAEGPPAVRTSGFLLFEQRQRSQPGEHRLDHGIAVALTEVEQV